MTLDPEVDRLMRRAKPRVLVTGSRDWRNPVTIQRALREAYDYLGDFTLMSGACPTGADRMAEEIAERVGLTILRYPADWETHGKRAGFVRNAHMVTIGADLCLAFVRDHSKGATMTAKMAVKAGIDTRIQYEHSNA